MLVKKMAQSREQRRRVFHLPSIERLVNVINDHAADLLAAVGLVQQVLSQCRSRDFGNVLVLADSFDLVLAKTAKPNAIFQLDHGATLRFDRYCGPPSRPILISIKFMTVSAGPARHR